MLEFIKDNWIWLLLILFAYGAGRQNGIEEGKNEHI